ncbi:serine protease [Patescibacteria group bacterium]|nr:MAG: serine protease [Patescibacteria group bacterium]
MKFDRPLPRLVGLIALCLLAGLSGAATALLFLPPAINLDSGSAERVPMPVAVRLSEAPPRLPVVSVALVPKKSLKPVAGGVAVADGDIAGSATVLTSDGWLVTDKETFNSIIEPQVLLPRGAVLPPVQTVTDAELGLVFFRAEAKDLDVVPFGESAALPSGVTLFRAVSDQALASVVLAKARARPRRTAQDVVRVSSAAPERLILAGNLPREAGGSGLLTASGQLVAIVGGEPPKTGVVDEAVPIEAVARTLRDIARTGGIHRPTLGLATVDLTELASRDAPLQRSFGALVVSVETAGPAKVAGLKVGDRIVSLGREALDGNRLLSDLLSSYRIGETVSLAFVRDGSEKTVEVTVADTLATGSKKK